MGLWDETRQRLGRALGELGDTLTGEPDVSAEQMQKALARRGLAAPTEDTPRALFYDPYSTTDFTGWREKPSELTYETLRRMAVRNNVISAVVQLRVNQVGQYARPQQGRYDRGFKVVLRDRRDRRRAMSRTEEKEARNIERFLETTGMLLPDERPSDRDNFKAFLKKWVRDCLIYDQVCAERIRDRAGRISRFYCLPAETIRPAAVDWEHLSLDQRREHVTHVQVYENTVIAEFGPDDIIWGVMNPRSDLRANWFGFSPVEQCVNLVTAWLYGFGHNVRHFSNGANIPGIINIKGAIPDRQLKAFRRMWYSMIAGPENAFRTPILNADDLQWISMHANNRDMEFSAWMDWLTKLICGVFGVDPMEINFIYGNTGQTSTLNQSDNEKRLVESKDKGLRPLMDHIADTLNQYLLWEINPDFEFVFAGLDAKSEHEEREAAAKDVATYKTVDEVRAERDEPPLPDGKGEVILNTVWLQYVQGAQAEGEGGTDPFGGAGDGLGDGAEEEGDTEGEDESDAGGEDEGQGEDQNQDEPRKEQRSLDKALRRLAGFVPEDELRKATVTRMRRGDVTTIDIEIPEE